MNSEKQAIRKHWYSVRTTPAENRARGVYGYFVNLREYRRAINRRGVPFNKWIGFVHISNDIFPTRKEALAFGRAEVAKRKDRP